jgi:alpha-mannosidase
MKRWNRKNELLADAAERASVAAAWLGAAPYPAKKLIDAWYLVLGSQMHDMLPGTSLPKCYEYCWNDDLLALNQFAAVTTDAVGAVAAQMDTRVQGVPLVVYNPLSTDREDVIEAMIEFPGAAPKDVDVFDSNNQSVPSQVIAHDGNRMTVLILARVPSVGLAVFDVRPSDDPLFSFPLKANDRTIENELLRVTVNEAGDIASIFDKKNNREALSAPAQLAMLYENPAQYPAWNMDWNDRKNPPRSYVSGPARVRVIEQGRVRVALEVTRQCEGSRFVQRISLTALSDRVEVANLIDWQTPQRSLKACFPLSVSNPNATYDIAVGAIERCNNEPKKYEVPQHQWIDLTDRDGQYGVAILNDSKYGSDKPDDNTLRLTLLYTPGTRGGYRDQGTQDFGRHEIAYAIAPHTGDWRQAKVSWQGRRFNQPMLAFQSPAHPGALGRSFSLIKLNTEQVAIEAIKTAEDGDEIIVRLKELTGQPAQNVRVISSTSIAAAREVTGQEKPMTAAVKIGQGVLSTDLSPFQLRAFAVKLGNAPVNASLPQSQSVALAYDLDAISSDANRADGAFDNDGRSFPTEQLPHTVVSEGIAFTIGPASDGEKNVLKCRGQTIQLPQGFSRLYVLACAVDGEQDATFRIGDKPIAQRVQAWSGFIGQWDNRLWSETTPETSTEVRGEMCGLVPGYTKRDTVAWYCSHRHHPTGGNEHYQYCYLFKYAFDIPAGATSVTLPQNDKIRVFAMTVAKNGHDAIVAAHPLYDTLADHAVDPTTTTASISPAGGTFNDVTRVTLHHPLYWKTGTLRYTLDGSEPVAGSKAYDGKPILLSSSARIRARQFDESGRVGPEASAELNVNDTTAPKVKSIWAATISPVVRIDFTEPLSPRAAGAPANYRFDPPVTVRSAELSDDGMTVRLTLAERLTPKTPYTVSLREVGDASPASNRVAPDTIALAVARPVFSLDSITCPTEPPMEVSLPDLPAKAADAWTMNLFVRTDQQPENRTIIAGFGAARDTDSGIGRYLCKFGRGVHFWSRGRDVESRRAPFDLNRWQMITATYDGKTLRLYKDATNVGEREVSLDDDEQVVRVAPLDPWDKRRRFKGEIRQFTIWDAALLPEAIKSLQETQPTSAPMAEDQK